MKREKLIFASVLLSGSMGLGAHALFAQAVPGPSGQNQRPGMPEQTQPTIPGQPAPGLPQREPLPGRPGTIPEQVQPPQAPRSQDMAVSPDHIRKAQEALKAQGLDPGPVTGRMDPKTQQALSQFQKANNLPATGVLDQKTADKLGITLQSDKGAEPQQKRQENTSPGLK
jgi:peptidoglycan hydrolase-like protein with peptidoglycan-binding domain